MNINTDSIFKEALQEFLPDFKKKAKDFFRTFFERRLGAYFLDPHEVQKMKQDPGMARFRGINPNDQDLGLAYNMIDGFITENILEENFKQYMEDYMKTNFQKHLDEAMDKAMKHKASSMAFHAIRNRAMENSYAKR